MAGSPLTSPGWCWQPSTSAQDPAAACRRSSAGPGRCHRPRPRRRAGPAWPDLCGAPRSAPAGPGRPDPPRDRAARAWLPTGGGCAVSQRAPMPMALGWSQWCCRGAGRRHCGAAGPVLRNGRGEMGDAAVTGGPGLPEGIAGDDGLASPCACRLPSPRGRPAGAGCLVAVTVPERSFDQGIDIRPGDRVAAIEVRGRLATTQPRATASSRSLWPVWSGS